MSYIPSSGRTAASFRTRTGLAETYGTAQTAQEKDSFLNAVAQQALLGSSGLPGSADALGLAGLAGTSGLYGAYGAAGLSGISGSLGLSGGFNMASLLSGQGSLFGINMMPTSLLQALATLEETQAAAAAERLANRLSQAAPAETATPAAKFLSAVYTAAAAGAAQSAAAHPSQPDAARQARAANVLTAACAAQTAGAQAVEETAAVAAPSLESMLKAKYPGLAYHVFDASSGYWRTRNDYPHHLLYQEGDEAKETLENWKPNGPNPFYGSIDGKFIAPKEIHALGSIPPGSKAVVIHPAVQRKMEQDPAYANEIFAKIDTWFTFDVLRNESMLPGSTATMSQAVAIGEDGNICNACSSTPGGTITTSGDEMVQAYRQRMAKRTKRMREMLQRQIEQGIETRRQNAAYANARAQLTQMLESGRLREIFGDTIAGNPTEDILGLVRAELAGTAA